MVNLYRIYLAQCLALFSPLTLWNLQQPLLQTLQNPSLPCHSFESLEQIYKKLITLNILSQRFSNP